MSRQVPVEGREKEKRRIDFVVQEEDNVLHVSPKRARMDIGALRDAYCIWKQSSVSSAPLLFCGLMQY